MRLIAFALTLALFQVVYAEPAIESFGALPTIQNMAVSPGGELIQDRRLFSGLETHSCPDGRVAVVRRILPGVISKQVSGWHRRIEVVYCIHSARV
jgi:hypothetical protein